MILGGDMGKIRNSVEDFLRLTYKSNNRIISIIDDLLVAMDVEEGRLKIEKSPVEIEAIARSVLISYEHDITIKKLKTKFSSRKNTLSQIDADPIKLRQALSRIVHNAVIFTREGGSVFLSVLIEKKNATITVEDSGIGIPAPEMKHLFQKFYRASNAMKMHPDASGLGLYIAKAIIEAHGGSIDITSKEAVGTKVTITLPTVNYA